MCEGEAASRSAAISGDVPVGKYHAGQGKQRQEQGEDDESEDEWVHQVHWFRTCAQARSVAHCSASVTAVSVNGPGPGT